MKHNLNQKLVEKCCRFHRNTVRLSVKRSGLPVNVAANLIPKSCNINDYIEAMETLKVFGLSDRYADMMIAEAENQLWGDDNG